MSEELLADRLRRFQGRLTIKEAAAKLDLPYGTFRKYSNGHRTPNKMAMAELLRRLAELENTTNEQAR